MMDRTLGRQTLAVSPGRIRIRDLYLDRLDLPAAMERIEGFLQEGWPHQVVTVNVRFVTIASQDPAFARVVNGAHMAVADGMPLIWLSRLMGAPIPQRITGSDLLFHCASLAAQRGHSIFLLGAAPGVAQEAAWRLVDTYPGLRIAGIHHGYFSQAEEQEVLRCIRQRRPQFLFVALGCPRQEFWIHRHLDELEVPVCVGIGGILDVISGRLKRAPLWMQRCGLEWSYRLAQEPRRLWKRYIVEDVPTTFRIAGLALRQRLLARVDHR